MLFSKSRFFAIFNTIKKLKYEKSTNTLTRTGKLGSFLRQGLLNSRDCGFGIILAYFKAEFGRKPDNYVGHPGVF